MKRKQRQGINLLRKPNDARWLSRVARAGKDARDLRRYPRKAIRMNVSLNQCMTCYGRGQIRDLSLHGAFVELPKKSLSAGMSIQIGFPFQFGGSPIQRWLSARVMRVEPEGVALQFNQYNPDFYGDLFTQLGSA